MTLRSALAGRVIVDRAGTSYATHSGAPTGGWNTRDSVVNMDSRDALILDNWFPQASEVWQRGGYTSWATGMTGTVKSLFAYNPTTGSSKFFAFTNAGVYDISATGVVAGVMAGGVFTNGYVSATTITNSAGTTYLWVCNETDNPRIYDGAAWAIPAVTGLTVTNIAQVWLFKHRIWFVEKGTMNAWYLPVDSIQGAATQYPMGNLFGLGGHLVAGTSWTLDGGDGPDDVMAVITSEGQLAVFQGIDPNSAAAWSLSGVYQVGRPCGRRCFFKLGGDTGLITENGVFPLSRALQLGSMNFAAALSNKIQPSFVQAVTTSILTTEGWEGCVYPTRNALVINIPASILSDPLQYVMNTITGQWCSFSGWSANCFAVFDAHLYFGTTGGKVKRAWTGESDEGTNITTTVHQAYQYLGSSARMKKVKLLRFLLQYDGSLDIRWGISADYAEIVLNSLYPGTATPSCAIWDISDWDTSWWCLDATRLKQWKAVFHPPGYALSVQMITVGKTSDPVKWAGTDFIVDVAGRM